MSQHVLSSLGATAALQRSCPGLREAEAVRGSTSPDTPTAEPSLRSIPEQQPEGAAIGAETAGLAE